jgi:hypothetical protein
MYVVVLAALSFLLAPAARAFTLNQGQVEIHLKDATTLYTDADSDPSTPKLPRAPKQWDQNNLPDGFAPHGAAMGDESRSVLHVDQFTYNTGNVNTQIGELTGLVYDLTLAALVDHSTDAIPLPTVDLFWTGGVTQLYLDKTPDNADGVGGVTYSDTFDALNNGLMPKEWEEGGTPFGDGIDNVNMTTVLGASAYDATNLLVLEANFVPLFYLPDGTPITLVTHINLSSGSGNADDAYLDIVVDNFDDNFGGVYWQENTFAVPGTGAPADLLVAYTTREWPNPGYWQTTPYAYEGGWELESSDPIQGVLIPEPATLSLLGIGLAALGFAKRRK